MNATLHVEWLEKGLLMFRISAPAEEGLEADKPLKAFDVSETTADPATQRFKRAIDACSGVEHSTLWEDGVSITHNGIEDVDQLVDHVADIFRDTVGVGIKVVKNLQS